MTIKLICILLILFLIIFIGCENQVQPTQSAISEDFEGLDKPVLDWENCNNELEKNFCSKVTAKDADGLMKCFWKSPNLISVGKDGMVYRGWDNVRDSMKELFETHEVITVEINNTNRFCFGNNVYADGYATWTKTLKSEYGGGTSTYTEMWTDVRQKVKGEWVIIMHHPHDLTPFTWVVD